MVYRVYVEKKKQYALEAAALKNDICSLLGIKGLRELRIVNCYDVEGVDAEFFDYCVKNVFSEPQIDIAGSEPENTDGKRLFAVEYLPGQFDQRADSAAQCIELISKGNRPLVHSSKLYILDGELTDADIERITAYVINPVESRQASLEKPSTLRAVYDIPEHVPTIDGFITMSDEELKKLIGVYGLAMDADDILFCRDWFRGERRDPTMTELRVIDTYWSDHCRHTTFLTTIDSVRFCDKATEEAYEKYLADRKALGRTKPVNLMDIATLAAKVLRADGKLDKLDESEEINACTVKIEVEADGEKQPWLLLFKNETHNHPTEIEPFGGAATCIGGAIRDPLSGRAYVYAAMRLTGAADPLKPMEDTIKGKLPQRKIVTTAAAGYSSYGNQIGLATGIVDELYHPGYAAKRMEIGAVVGAAPEKNVKRLVPIPGDAVILLGGRTGRDGCGGATGSSKKHTLASLETCGAEVQKGNAPEERKLQRLMRREEAASLIKRCNDFGAGGVSVAIGELADGLKIDLNAVTKKYDGLDGTELAISESQERMAVVVAREDAERFISLAYAENLEAAEVAQVTESPRMVMSWNGRTIVDLSREFLDSNGAEKHIDIAPAAPESFNKPVPADFAGGMRAIAGDLNTCSRRGLSERFDSTIGAGTVLMPFGGKRQLTPVQAMAHKISMEKAHTDDCSVMSWGYDPFISEKDPFRGAYTAVISSVAKLAATGADIDDTYLTFQEYFEKPGQDPARWGKPLSALLGAYKAQTGLGIAAIGGKDSMSGSFESLDVPPTLVSFAITTEKAENIVSPEFKAAGHDVIIIEPEYGADGLIDCASFKSLCKKVTALMRSGKAVAAYTPCMGGVAEAVLKMCMGNAVGFEFTDADMTDIFGQKYGSFILELTGSADGEKVIGRTLEEPVIALGGERLSLYELEKIYEDKLEPVFPVKAAERIGEIPAFSFDAKATVRPAVHIARPRVLIPVFPGTNCEYDAAKAMRDAGAEPDVVVINNVRADSVEQSVECFAKKLKNSQIVFIPGGFSGGDEPDGSGKFITAFMRNAEIKDGINELLKQRDGLMCGICNGFQALIKLGLVPYGEILDADADMPTLTFNTIGRHQSRLVRTRVSSNKSPWLKNAELGGVYNVAVSHGEGRFIASDELILKLAKNGQIATQYCDENGVPTYDIRHNPNNSDFAIEGITSPDGRVFGKMGHTERKGSYLYKNVPGEYDLGMFEAAVEYFK